jgi:NADPH:quinone reductase-like Zn-dependent oxidoreductase
MSEEILNNHAVILNEYNPNLVRAILGLKKSKRELRELNKDEVLIRMEATTCNPSDIAFIRGGYNIQRKLPAVPGFEGTGIVVKTGDKAKALIGKRVSSFTQSDADGTWAEYYISKAEDCIVIKDGLNFEQAASLSINPFTAYGLIEMALNNKCRTIIQNAGGGQIAAFIRTLAELNGIQTVNIVRKEESANSLKEAGVSHVLDSSNINFKEELKTLAFQLNATMAFDAVGSEQTGILLQAMPPQAKVVLYGGLAGGLISGIEPFDIIFRDKKLVGFNLTEWKSAKSKADFEKISNQLQEWMIGGVLKSQIQAIFKLDEVVNGLRTYIKSMSAGKILFVP